MSPREPQAEFRTHANYLRAFGHLAHQDCRPDRRMAFEAIREQVLESDLLPVENSEANLSQVQTSLQNAWGTELLLTLGEDLIRDEEVIRLSNNWNVVQGYYILYHIVQAVVVAKGNARPTSHPKTQQWYFQLFTRSRVCLAPWTLGFGSDGPVNIPEGVKANHRMHSWTACDDQSCWGLGCKALRTTREDAIPERRHTRRERKRTEKRRAWLDEEQKRLAAGRSPRVVPRFPLPRLTEAEKAEVNGRLRPYTLMDYLYRLRIRSNYEDSAMFTDGPEDDGPSEQVRHDISFLTGSAALLGELFVGRLVGAQQLGRWADEWLERNRPPDWSGGIVARRDLIEET